MNKNPNYEPFIKQLKKAMKSIDAEKNPRLFAKACELARSKTYECASDFDLALELDRADPTQRVPKEIADLMEMLYLRATKSNDWEDKGAAFNNLGSLYYHRRAGRKDYKKAVRYYILADEAGYRLASENLAYCYYYGQGSEINYEKAYYYFSKAALAGRYEAMYKLGDMFRNGFYVEKDEDMVRVAYINAEYMMKAAWDTLDTEGINYGSVYMRLGDMYFEGIGMTKDNDKAYECYQRAERGFYDQLRRGHHYTDKDLRHVNTRLKELKKVLVGNLPKLDW